MQTGPTHRMMIVSVLFIALVLSGCSGYYLVLKEATVLEHDANHLAYRVVVKNEKQTSACCETTRFYGNAAFDVYLANEPRRENASIVKPAGGAASIGREIPGDPNNAYGFRVIEVDESALPVSFSNVRVADGIDVNSTPYVIFELKSSTDRHYDQTFKTGTGGGGCIRYGATSVVDLRTLR
jgi:hypothetical protein